MVADAVDVLGHPTYLENDKKSLCKKMNIKHDCFGYNGRRCTVLKTTQCDDCIFYKTKKQFKADRLKALQRIMNLDKDLKNYIIQKYKIKEGINVGDKN